ncbi:MAG: hypothetical protein HYV28_18490, partial [Ignavibacteriales bacterium]|nr:hypothetical protein [Ignavibacteriales bacterium]
MKQILLIIFLAAGLVYSQQIGEFAPEKEPVQFPPNAAGADLIFSEGGFGLGGFYRRTLNKEITVFSDISFSETKDEKEVEYYDYYTGQSIVYGKKNRIFILPLYAGVQYRLFSDDLTDNLRPYINCAAGPTMVITTPYDKEFFSSFGKA